jgi:hypothetical protein
VLEVVRPGKWLIHAQISVVVVAAVVQTSALIVTRL